MNIPLTDLFCLGYRDYGYQDSGTLHYYVDPTCADKFPVLLVEGDVMQWADRQELSRRIYVSNGMVTVQQDLCQVVEHLDIIVNVLSSEGQKRFFIPEEFFAFLSQF